MNITILYNIGPVSRIKKNCPLVFGIDKCPALLILTPFKHVYYLISVQRINIGDRCVNSINHFLECIAKEVKSLLGALCDERMSIDDQLLPFRGAGHYLANHIKREKKGGPKQMLPVVTPGTESSRRTREDSVK